MKPDQTITALKGKPITIFFMLCVMGGNSGVKKLAEKLGWSQPTISAGLQQLKLFELVTQTGRYNGWTLTSAGHQLSMNLITGDQKSLSPAPSSSINLIESSKDEDLLTTSPIEAKKFDLEVYDLLKTGGIGEPKRTKLSQMNHITPEYVEAHLASGEDLPLIIWRMEREYKPPERSQIEYFPCEKCARLTTDKICEDCDD